MTSEKRAAIRGHAARDVRDRDDLRVRGAQAACEAAGKRLCTKEEWTAACAGPPPGKTYPFGEKYEAKVCNDAGNAAGMAVPAGSLKQCVGAIPGVFDLAGNVWEWTADWYQPYPGNNVPDEFYGEKFRVLRGGGWFDEPDQVLASNRSSTSPEAANDNIGFRCAADVK